eukprot:759104-Hanusia_phi.AAC.1
MVHEDAAGAPRKRFCITFRECQQLQFIAVRATERAAGPAEADSYQDAADPVALMDQAPIKIFPRRKQGQPSRAPD